MSDADVGQKASRHLGERHRPSGLNSYFTPTRSTFSEYIRSSRDMIAQARCGQTGAELEQIIEGNSPFELYPEASTGKEHPYRRGILLVHGLSDSPYFMRHLATIFCQNGFRVMAVLLPGHGTRPGDLLEVSWQAWLKAVEYGIEQLAKEVDEVYLGGYSAGGALSVYQSGRDERVRGLFLFAPALKISPRAAFAAFHKSYSWLMPTAKWLAIKPDNDHYKYESFPKNAAAQMYALTQMVQKQITASKLRIPVFAVVSQDDATVCTQATVQFMQDLQHDFCNLLYLYSDPERIPSGLPIGRLESLDSRFPEQGIVSAAHTAIVLPRDDNYYGEAGTYRNCLHYHPDAMSQYEACQHSIIPVKQGEITEQLLKSGLIRRLMFNPNFSAMEAAIRRFIAVLPS